MHQPVTGLQLNKPRRGSQEILLSLWASQKAWMAMMCLFFAAISCWFSWSYYSALFNLPLLRRSALLKMLGGADIAGVAIPAILRRTLAHPLNMPLNGNALWYKKEAVNWVREYLPIGNGYLGGECFRSILTLSSYWNASFCQRWYLAV